MENIDLTEVMPWELAKVDCNVEMAVLAGPWCAQHDQLFARCVADAYKKAQARHTLGQVVKMTGEMPVKNTMGLSWQHGYERALEDLSERLEQILKEAPPHG